MMYRCFSRPSTPPVISAFVFFFQAEAGIRDKLVTGVQTCALPISPARPAIHRRGAVAWTVWQGGRAGSVLHPLLRLYRAAHGSPGATGWTGRGSLGTGIGSRSPTESRSPDPRSPYARSPHPNRPHPRPTCAKSPNERLASRDHSPSRSPGRKLSPRRCFVGADARGRGARRRPAWEPSSPAKVALLDDRRLVYNLVAVAVDIELEGMVQDESSLGLKPANCQSASRPGGDSGCYGRSWIDVATGHQPSCLPPQCRPGSARWKISCNC